MLKPLVQIVEIQVMQEIQVMFLKPVILMALVKFKNYYCAGF